MKYLLALGTLACLVFAGCDSSGADADRATSLTLNPASLSLRPGETRTLTTTILDRSGRAVSATVTWRSLNESIATVTSAGLVRGVALGTTQVIAQVGSGVADTAHVIVNNEALLTYNVNANTACTSPDIRSFRVAATSQHAIVLADTGNPAGGFTDADYQGFASAFDTVVWPVATRNFGTPTDLDGNGKVLILFTRAVNELTASGSNTFVGGFFFGRDLFPRQDTPRFAACPSSNLAEMFYMLVPDPNGEVNNNARTVDFVRQRTVGTIAHEFQHLINASRRMHVNNATAFEQVWLNEGLSHIAEELVFYEQSGLAPRSNIDLDALRVSQQRVDAFNSFANPNFGRLRRHLENPPANSPYDTDDDVATRGAAWQFLRYAMDRRGGSETDFWNRLVNAQTIGFTNLEAALGTAALPYFQDWAVSVYTDDVVATGSPRFTQPSWNFRSVYAGIGGFPLQTVQIRRDTTVALNVRAGSAAYLRFGTPAGGQTQVRVSSGGVGPTGTCGSGETPLTLAPGEVRMLPSGPAFLCVAGGAAGSEYTLIPFYGSAAQNASLAVEVAASGVTPSIAATQRLEPSLPLLQRSEAGPSPNVLWEAQLRERERRELGPLIRGAAPSFSVSGSRATPDQLTVTLVRTR